VSITDRGIQETGLVAPPQDNAELHREICGMLKPKARAIFAWLADGRRHGPDGLLIAGAVTNLATKSFRDGDKELREYQLVEGKLNDIRLTSVCFPFDCSGNTVHQTPQSVANVTSNEEIKQDEYSKNHAPAIKVEPNHQAVIDEDEWIDHDKCSHNEVTIVAPQKRPRRNAGLPVCRKSYEVITIDDDENDIVVPV